MLPIEKARIAYNYPSKIGWFKYWSIIRTLIWAAKNGKPDHLIDLDMRRIKFSQHLDVVSKLESDGFTVKLSEYCNTDLWVSGWAEKK